jgi:hypothetical protein
MNKKIYSILILAFLSSCYSYDENSYQKQQNNSQSVIYQKTTSSFFWGLKEGAEKPGEKPKCNSKDVVKIKTKNGFVIYLERIYSLGIYWPQTLEIECNTAT